MTVFLSSSTNQEEIMPGLYPREPSRAAYPEIPFQGSAMYFHHSSSSPCAMNSHHSSEEAAMYDAWREEGRNEMLLMQTVGESTNGHNFSLSGSAMQGQGLSLSLATQVPVPTFHYLPATADISFAAAPNQTAALSGGSCKKSSMMAQIQPNSPHPSVPYLMCSTLNLSYLRATRELLDEVVNVRKALVQRKGKSQSEVDGGSLSREVPSISKDDSVSSSKELSASERQEFQSKLTKLMEMVDEVCFIDSASFILNVFFP